jgi:hypothetical protein
MRVLLLLYLLAALTTRADDRNIAPSLDRQVDAEWPPELQKSFIVAPVRVEIVIDPQGVPFSLNSPGLPDSLVRALALWRFHPGRKDGKESAFAVVVYVPERIALTTSAERGLRRRWFPQSLEFGDVLKQGAKLDEAGAARIAALPQSDPQSTNARFMLLAYAAANLSDAARKIRSDHITWMVENEPESQFLGSPLVVINPTDGPLADKDSYQKIRGLWLKQLEQKPDDRAILDHATNFTRVSDHYATESSLLSGVSKVSGAAAWLGELYGLSALGVTGLDPQSGAPATAGPADSPFAAKAETALATSSDPRIVLAAAQAIITGGRALNAANLLPAHFADLCAQIAAHAKKLYPATVANCDLSAPDPYYAPPVGSGPIERVRIGGSYQQAHLVKRVTPEYPDGLKMRGIQGTIEFNAVIGKDGKVQSLVFLSGPLALYKPAHDAVSKWEYKPTTLNGRPVEVLTKISVNYELVRR